MTITNRRGQGAPWLLLVFTLPSNKASERVGVWRKLQKFGSVQLRNAGYMLPNNPLNQERLEWLAREIRGFKGEASVLQVRAIDDLSPRALQDLFRRARIADYESLIEEIRKLKPGTEGPSPGFLRLHRKYEEIVEIDFFDSPLRKRAEAMLKQAGRPRVEEGKQRGEMASKASYQNRTWMTRPRPGIDRVSSAWLITRFIDSNPQFIFGKDAKGWAGAVPFDMFHAGGFGHEEDHCTFETICRRFGIKDKAVRVIAEAIHDADLEDGRYGRTEGIAINNILRGWDRQGLSNEDLLKRGMELIEGMYLSLNGDKKRD